MVYDDVYTSLHIDEFSVECRDTKLGKEEFTYEIPNVKEETKKNLDARGIVIPGTEVKEGDILVGKITPKGVTDPTPEERLLLAIFGEKAGMFGILLCVFRTVAAVWFSPSNIFQSQRR